MDQPAGLIEKMNIAENTYSAYRDYKRVPAKDLGAWIKAHPSEWQAVQHIQKMRRDGG